MSLRGDVQVWLQIRQTIQLVQDPLPDAEERPEVQWRRRPASPPAPADVPCIPGDLAAPASSSPGATADLPPSSSHTTQASDVLQVPLTSQHLTGVLLHPV